MSVSPKFWALGGDLAPGSPDLPLPLVIPGFVSAGGEGREEKWFVCGFYIQFVTISHPQLHSLLYRI